MCRRPERERQAEQAVRAGQDDPDARVVRVAAVAAQGDQKRNSRAMLPDDTGGIRITEHIEPIPFPRLDGDRQLLPVANHGCLRVATGGRVPGPDA